MYRQTKATNSKISALEELKNLAKCVQNEMKNSVEN